jgi:hypothetical protein
MDHISLDLAKYKRFFAFGCSFTSYHWHTWADILGHHFGKEYYNFGSPGCCNDFIFRSVIEANQLYEFQSDDLIIIQWTEILRDAGWRPDTGLQGCGSIIHKPSFTVDHLMKLKQQEFLKRDLEYATAISMILESHKVDYHMFCMNNLTSTEGTPYQDVTPVVEFYSDVAKKFKPSFQETVQWVDQQGVMCSNYPVEGKIEYDKHPTPAMHLKHLQTVFPDLAVDESIIKLISEVESKLRTEIVGSNNVLHSLPRAERFVCR